MQQPFSPFQQIPYQQIPTLPYQETGYQVQQQPGAPWGQPGFQAPFQVPFQPGFQAPPQPVAQPLAQPLAQPVACPAYVPPGGAGVSPNQALHQTHYRSMIVIARALEQAVPAYQVLFSVLQDVIGSGQVPTGSQPLVETLQTLNYVHSAALGTIRRFLCGEATADVLTALATHVNQLMGLQSQVRPLMERVVMATSPDHRTPLSSLVQSLPGLDSLVSQGVVATQATVGTQIWDAARTRVFGTAPSSGQG